MIGTRFRLNVGGDNVPDKFVDFMIVDPNCPTIRDKPNDSYRRYEGGNVPVIQNALRAWEVQVVLVTPTNPVKMVIVFETFPRMEASYIVMPRHDFDHFRYVLCAPKKPTPKKSNKINWMKEGF